MYSQLCACFKAHTFGSKSAHFILTRAGLCCSQRYSTGPDTHYEVLNLKRNCSPKEIRSAFIRLSKEFHPDKDPSNPALHEKFVKLNEAYSTLNDMDLRRNYDASLNLRTIQQNKFVYRKEAPSATCSERPENWKEFYNFEEQLKRNESIHVPKFLYKFASLSRAAIVILLVGVATSLFGLQILAAQYSKSFPRDIMTAKDIEISRNLMMARSNAQKYDLQENVDRFAKRVKESQSGRSDL